MNKRAFWCIIIAILAVGALAFSQMGGGGVGNYGSASVYDTIYPPADPYANYVPPTNYIYPPADAGTAPIYPPADYIYPPADAGTAPIYPPANYIYPPADAGTAPIYPPAYY